MFLDLILKRRSIRTYESRSIEKEKIEKLKKTALLAASSRSLNPCEYIFISKKYLLEKLSQAKPDGASFLINAPLAIVICADEKKSDVWIEDAALATTYLMLCAHTLGLGSCWVQVRNRNYSSEQTAEEYLKGLLKIPAHFRVLSMLGVGYPAEKRPSYSLEELDFTRIHDEEYAKPGGRK
jgi:nitroreductase